MYVCCCDGASVGAARCFMSRVVGKQWPDTTRTDDTGTACAVPRKTARVRLDIVMG